MAHEMSRHPIISPLGVAGYIAIFVVLFALNYDIKCENNDHKFHWGQDSKKRLLKNEIERLKLDRCGCHHWPSSANKKPIYSSRSPHDEGHTSDDARKNLFVNRRMTHGREAKLKQFPSFVRIELYNTSHPNHFTLCGGTLIARDLVITAAHCITESHNIARLTAGVVRWDSKFSKHVKDKQQVYARKICSHKNFSSLSPAEPYIQRSLHDLAVIQLERKLRLTDSVQPACLIQGATKMGDSLYTIGMGQVELHESSDALNYVAVEKETNCEYSDKQWDSCYTPTPMGEICYGDSGSGLILVKNGRQYLVGITSSNTVDECSSGRQVPTVYADNAKEKAEVMEMLQYCYEKN